MERIEVNAKALRIILQALMSDGAGINELVALRGFELGGYECPIKILVDEYNAEVNKRIKD